MNPSRFGDYFLSAKRANLAVCFWVIQETTTMDIHKISVVLSSEELSKLKRIAGQEQRHPRQQARYFVLAGLDLIGNNNGKNNNGATKSAKTVRTAVE